MAPLEVIDYIVVHEMTHMVHKDHSKIIGILFQKLFQIIKNKNLVKRKWNYNGYIIRISPIKINVKDNFSIFIINKIEII